MIHPTFTTREQYQRVLTHLHNGIAHARIGSRDRARAEAVFDRVAAEMAGRFPILLYTVEWFVDGAWRATSSMQMNVPLDVAELRRDRTIARTMDYGWPIRDSRIVQTGRM